MSQWNYVATAHKPTAVTHSCSGNFTASFECNLIIAKCSRIEIHLVTSDGALEPVLDVPIYGRIVSLELFRPKGETQDLLFITTERHEYFVLQWDAKAHDLITRLKGDVSGETGHPINNGQIGMIDPDCRLIGLHLYDGLFKVIPFGEEGKLKEAFSIRFEPQPLDMKFLYDCPMPTVVVLYQDNEDARHVKAYEFPLGNGDDIGSRDLKNLDSGAYLLIPVSPPLGGVLIIGEDMIAYCDASAAMNTYQIGKGLQSIKAYDQVSPCCYVLGDHNGDLHLLEITRKNERVTGITIKLGETSIASTISHLGDNFVYIGSSHGDSQLVKFSLQPGMGYIEVLNRFDNWGPIGDFYIVDGKKLGQRRVVTCSGGYKDGSLRIAQNRFGMHEHASVELEGIKGMWSLPSATGRSCDHLVVSFVNSTHVYQIEPDCTSSQGFTSSKTFALVDASIKGFNFNMSTLVCHHAKYDQLVQVTPRTVRLVCSVSNILKHEWIAPGSLTLATANTTQVLLAIGDSSNILVCLTIENGNLKETASAKLDGAASCLSITPIDEKANCGIAAIGLWEDRSVNIYSLPGLEFIGKEFLGEIESLPRSVLMCSFDGRSYLFCGLADGHLIHFEINMATGQLKGGEKKLSLGTLPVTLCAFLYKESTRVFAASDTSSMVIYNNNNKMFCGEVNNLKDVMHVSPYIDEYFPNSFAIAKGGQLAICSIDEKQKLHIIHSQHLGERVLRISHQEQSQTIAILTVKWEDSDAMVSLVQLYDDQTCQLKSTYELAKYEYGCSILSCSFSEDDNVYYCVGTAYMMLNQNQCTQGRILVLQVVGGRELHLVTEMETNGAVYCLNGINGKLLSAINENIQLYRWASNKNGRDRELKRENLYHGRVVSRFMQTQNNLILVGDAMRSISLLSLKQEEETYTIEELARDGNVNWMSAVEFLCGGIYLGARNNLDLFTLTKRWKGAAYRQQRELLEVVGMFHLGEFVNRFRRNSLVTLSEDSEMMPSVIFGTINGVIGVIASLPQEKYEFFEKMQRKLRKSIKCVGDLSHEKWRSSREDLSTMESRNFLDGDLIQSFLNLSMSQKEEIAQEMEVASGELVKVVEELTHLVLVESFSL